MGLDLDRIAEKEHDAALGNGGLGRLAACFMESLATLGYAAMGCGIKYDYGLFRQVFVDGRQVELADHWDAERSPWMLERVDECCTVDLYGHVEHDYAPDGAYRPRWVPGSTLTGVPHDMPVVGHGNRSANVLRLYAARASDVFDMQISTAGTEASGTGNMKLALNGALTVDTLDGANIEIRECVGDDNFYAFGLTADQVQALQRSGSYRPAELIAADPALAEILESLVDGRFCADREAYRPLYDELCGRDRYFNLTDFASYAAVHRRLCADFADRHAWHRRALAGMAWLGRFSSDRTVREYAQEIWKLPAPDQA